MTLVVLFDWDLDFGRCIGVRLPNDQFESRRPMDDPRVQLSREDWALADELPQRRRRPWVAGRAAMRIALAREGIDSRAIGRDDRGAPVLPAGCSGSISHKEVQRPDDLPSHASCEGGDVIAVALVKREPVARLGVDVEFDRAPSVDIASHVLTSDEDAALADLDPATRPREVVLRFSAKEALYKAVDPFVRRHIGFKEVKVTPHPDGSGDVEWRLAGKAGEPPFESRVLWRRELGLVVTMARVWRAG
jgi:4'-phosphopantetheinyl transferase EntD